MDRLSRGVGRRIVAGTLAALAVVLEGAERPMAKVSPLATVASESERRAHPCRYEEEYRQLDFWIGEWDVRPNGAPPTTPPSRSRIESVEDQCVILETYTTPGSYSGRSFNVWDRQRKQWRQVWVDTQGRIAEYSGVSRDGNLYYTAEGVLGPGHPGPAKMKMTFFGEARDRVRQLVERSLDEGVTWTVVFDGVYTRRVTPPSPGAE